MPCTQTADKVGVVLGMVEVLELFHAHTYNHCSSENHGQNLALTGMNLAQLCLNLVLAGLNMALTGLYVSSLEADMLVADDGVSVVLGVI